MSTALFQHLARRNPGGLQHETALQLMLWLFLTVDILPEELRNEKVDRQYLEETFQELSRRELIGRPGGSGTDAHVVWQTVIDAFLLGELTLDRSFPDRAHRFL